MSTAARTSWADLSLAQLRLCLFTYISISIFLRIIHHREKLEWKVGGFKNCTTYVPNCGTCDTYFWMYHTSWYIVRRPIYLSLSLYQSLYLSLNIYIYLYLSLSISLSLSQHISIHISLYIHLYIFFNKKTIIFTKHLFTKHLIYKACYTII